MDNFPKLIRRLGCPIIGLITILFINITAPWYVHLIAFGLFYAIITTYLDSIFGYDQFWVTGFLYGFAYLPYALVNHFWLGFLIRCIVCSITIGGLNYLVNKFKIPYRDYIEELFRGWVIIFSLLLF